MKKVFSLVTLLMFPLVVFADDGIVELLKAVLGFVNTKVIPFIIGFAFLIFAINVIRYFVIGGSNEEGQKKAKALAIYSIAAFVFIIIFWGIINMLTSSLGLSGQTQPVNDYCPTGGCLSS